MHPEGFKPLKRAALSPATVLMTVTGCVVLFDTLTGMRLLLMLAGAQLRLFGQNPESAGTITSLFGTFDSLESWARVIARVLMGVLFGLAGLTLLNGLRSSLTGR